MQSFGSMDVLCMDKTGTLTNESILLEYYMDILGNENTEVLDLAYLNSSYHSGVRNPIDNAILACKSMPGREIHYAKLLTEYQKADEIPFDYTRKFVSTLVQDSTGNSHLIIERGYCTHPFPMQSCRISWNTTSYGERCQTKRIFCGRGNVAGWDEGYCCGSETSGKTKGNHT